MSLPTRIASLLSSATEILFALGLEDRIVAVGHECDHPPAAATKPRATFAHLDPSADGATIDRLVKQLLAEGRPLYEIDAPLLARLAPQLIVTQAQCDVCAVRYDDVVRTVRAFPSLQTAEVVALNPQSLGDVLDDVTRLGRAAGCEAAAQTFRAALERRIDAVHARTERLTFEQRPRTACIEWIEPLMIAGNWTPELVDLAGGRQSLAVAGRHSAYTPWDAVRRFDPEVIVVLPCGFDLTRTLQEAPRLTELPGWRDLAAVRSGRVFGVDGNALFNRSGPRIVDSLELLAGLLHPDLFAEQAVPFDPQGFYARL